MESLDSRVDSVASTARRWPFVALGVVMVLVIAGGLAMYRVMQRDTISYVVPAGYRGYLVTRWECPGGMTMPPADALTGARTVTLDFDAGGVLCLADVIPGNGFRLGGFTYPDGRPAPVTIGGTRSLDRADPLGEPEFVFTLASLGIGGPGQLGDECSLDDFLAARFYLSVPGRHACDPIWVWPGPGDGTPASMASPAA